VSFASEPGQDDGGLPPLNIEIPDDARELARDVLAYHRELRARRRRQRILRLLSPFGFIRHGTIFPLIATCVAMSLLIGAMLSVMTISPASAPTLDTSPPPQNHLPAGYVELGSNSVPVGSLTDSMLVLIPPTCGCGTTLEMLAEQSTQAHVGIYFVYYAPTSAALTRMAGLTTRYGEGVARTVADGSGLLFNAFEPYSLTAVLVHHDGTVDIRRSFPSGFDLTPALRGLRDTH
jgi:hypothetical protein